MSKHMDIYTYKYPIGVTAGIVAFNFPVMLPLWTASIALACGNSQIVKPSEKTPSAPEWLVELGLKAGFPPGLLSIAHGYGDVVDKIIEHPDIAAISFIGANRAGEYIYSKASALGKRVISNMGAKNHMILMPDANKQDAVNAIIGASLGAAG